MFAKSKYLIALGIFFIILPVFAIDTDRDGLSDELEAVYYTDPTNSDTDGDGYSDGVEVEFGYSPHLGGQKRMHESDYDGDGLNDWLERWFKSDIGKTDTDGDGYSDFDEVMYGYGPVNMASAKMFDREIVVDRTLQRLYYFVDGVKLANFPVSTGNPDSETPDGTFSIQRKIAEKRYVGPGYDLPHVQWNMEFLPMYYIHGTYWHNDFGKKTHSHGCVNMTTENAGLLYKYVDVDVPVTVTGTTPARFLVGT